jgi:predicted secreted protein
MSITGAIVLYAVTWFLVFFMVLPVRHVSQGDAGQIVPGTPQGAPVGGGVGRKARLTTFIAAGVWVVLASIIWSGIISIHDIDIRGVMDEETAG